MQKHGRSQTWSNSLTQSPAAVVSSRRMCTIVVRGYRLFTPNVAQDRALASIRARHKSSSFLVDMSGWVKGRQTFTPHARFLLWNALSKVVNKINRSITEYG